MSKRNKNDSKRPLTYEELIEIAEDFSDIEYLSDDNDDVAEKASVTFQELQDESNVQ